MQQLFFFDQQLFLFINHVPHTPLLNLFFEFLSGVGMFGMVWFVIAAILFVKEEKKDHWFLAPVILAGGTSWILVEEIIKPLAHRIRPTAEMGAIIVGLLKDDFSFPSSHATIAWAMAVVLSKKEPRAAWVFYLLAVLISLSRVYLGVHYPLDIGMGALLGWFIGSLSLWTVSGRRENISGQRQSGIRRSRRR